jgi:hypothetical protein
MKQDYQKITYTTYAPQHMLLLIPFRITTTTTTTTTTITSTPLLPPPLTHTQAGKPISGGNDRLVQERRTGLFFLSFSFFPFSFGLSTLLLFTV